MTKSATVPAGEDRRKREILDAAADCFMRRGYDATTIDEIADQLGATKGRIYHHYSAKADIFLAVYARAMTLAHAAVADSVKSDHDPVVKLADMARAHLASMTEHLTYHRVLNLGLELHWSEASLTPRQRERMSAVLALRDDYSGLFESVIRQGVAVGMMQASDPALAVRVILGMINSVSRWYQPRVNQSIADRAAALEPVVVLLLRSLRP